MATVARNTGPSRRIYTLGCSCEPRAGSLRNVARIPKVPATLMCAPFTIDEARQAGLTRRQLRGASWRRMGCGFYVWAGLPDSPMLRLLTVQRRLPAVAVFSGRTAAWLHGLDLPPCDPVDVTVPTPVHISVRAGVALRRAKLASNEVVRRNGMHATSILRTLRDLAAHLPLVEAVVAADMALHKRLCDLVQLRGYIAANGDRRGIARLRRVVALAEPAAESPMETRLRLLLVLAGLPRPCAQVPLHDEEGRFLGRPDLYYPNQRLGLEYDGASHSNSLANDDRRQNRLLTAGIRLLRFTAADLHGTPELVIGQVRAFIS